jgi:tetratricopeptide (TPR) repeat protein
MSVLARGLRTAIVLTTATFLLSSCKSDPQKAKAKYFASGQKYMTQKKYGDAALEFRNAIRIDPRFADAYYQLSQTALAQHDWRGAYASLGKAIDLDPALLDARLERAQLYIAARQFDKAVEDANAVLEKDPKNGGAYYVIGTSLLRQQKPEQSLAAFSKVAELLPNDANSYLNLAAVEISLRRLADAEEHLKTAVAKDPKSLRARLDLANFYRMENKLPEAQEALQAGIQSNPDAPQLYIDWANMLYDTGKPAEADAVLDRLRKQMPKSADAAIMIGDYFLLKNDKDKALAEYRRGLAASSGNIEIEKRMQELYLTTNQLEEAAKLDSQLGHQAPKDPLINVLHGRLLLAQGKKQDAIIALQNAVKNSPSSAPAHYHLALAYWQNGNLGQANSELLEALKASPGMPMVLRSLVQLNLLQNHISEAQVYAQELVQRNPADASARLLLSSIYLREGQLHSVEEQLLAANRLAPNQANVHVQLGMLNAQEKKWKPAEQEFETAIRLAPSDLTVVSAYADYLVSRQQTQQARALLEKYVESNPNNSPSRVMLGTLELQSKNDSAAQSQYEQAIQIDPKNILAYLRLGGMYQARNQSDAALVQYQKALDLQPNSAALIALVGNVYLQRNDPESARKYYARALQADPDFPVANANMAWVDAVEGKNLDAALAMAQKAKSQVPELPAITDVLAWVMYQRGNYTGAIPLLEDAVKKAPDSSQYHYHLGMALMAAGQKDRGRAQLQTALQMNTPLRPAEKEQAEQALAHRD